MLFVLPVVAFSYEDLVLEKYYLTRLKSTFCSHKYLPFPCYENKMPQAQLSVEFFSLIGNGLAVEISSPEENFASEETGLFTTGPIKADLDKREDLVSLGNYFKRGPEFVKQGRLSIFFQGQRIYESTLEFQINGQDSRSSPQKALRLKLEKSLPMSSFAPKSGEQKFTIYPLYRSLGGAKIYHQLINQIFSSKEIWFENWSVVPVVINNEFWGVYLLARPDLSIQKDFFGSVEGIEGPQLKEKEYAKFSFDKEALLKFLAFQRSVGNVDLIRNYRSFVHYTKLHLTYTDLDEVFNTGLNELDIVNAMESKNVKKIFESDYEKFKQFKKYWKDLLRKNPPDKVYADFANQNFLYLLFNDLRWGRPFRSNEDSSMRKQLAHFSEIELNEK